MANQEKVCKIHGTKTTPLPQQYYCKQCRSEYQKAKRKELMDEIKRNRQKNTVEAVSAIREEKPTIFD